MTYVPWEQREMKDPEENINHQEDIGLGIGLETILEVVLEIHKTEIEEIQECLIGLEINLEIIQVIDQMIEQEMVEMILDKDATGIVNIVIKMVIPGITVGICKPMLRNPEGLRRWMIEMMTHQTPSTPWWVKIQFLMMILMDLSEISLKWPN